MNFSEILDQDTGQYKSFVTQIKTFQNFIIGKYGMEINGALFHSSLFLSQTFESDVREFLKQKRANGEYIYTNNTRYSYMNAIMAAFMQIYGTNPAILHRLVFYKRQLCFLSKGSSGDIEELDDPWVKLYHALNMNLPKMVKLLCKLYILSANHVSLRSITLDQIIKTRIDRKVSGFPFLDMKNFSWDLDNGTIIQVPSEFIGYCKDPLRMWLFEKGGKPIENTSVLSESFWEQTGMNIADLLVHLYED